MSQYFVDATAGNDSSSGAKTEPWQSLASLGRVMPGDVVRFKRGEYWSPKSPVQFNSLVKYEDYGTGDRPVFEGGKLDFPYRISGNNGILRNLEFRNARRSCLISTHQEVTKGWLISGCRFTGAGLHGFQQSGGSGGSQFTFKNNEFDNNREFGLVLYGGVRDTLITGGSAHHNGKSGMSILSDATPSGVVIRKVHAHNNAEDGIGVSGTGAGSIIEECIAHHNGLSVYDRTGIKSFAPKSIIRKCFSFANALPFDNGHGIQLDYGATNSKVSENVCWSNAHSGISIGAPEAQIYHNILSFNKAAAISAFGPNAGGAKFSKNVLHGNGHDGFHVPDRLEIVPIR